VTDVERIDLTGSGPGLKLSQRDVFDLTSQRSDGKTVIWVTAMSDVTFADAGWSCVGSV
jgi:hypothetical protein